MSPTLYDCEPCSVSQVDYLKLCEHRRTLAHKLAMAEERLSKAQQRVTELRKAIANGQKTGQTPEQYERFIKGNEHNLMRRNGYRP